MAGRRTAALAAVVVLATIMPAGVACAAATPQRAAAPDRRAVPILLYHHVSAAPPGTRSPRLWVSGARFAAQVRALARAGYRAVTLERVLRAWRGEATLPRKPIVLTFDDGYRSQYTSAARVLRVRGWPGVLFLEQRRLGAAGGLSRAQVRRMLADGWELGGHTSTHPDLTTVAADRLIAEVQDPRTALQLAFEVGVEAFAYPFGRHDRRVRDAVRTAGFAVALTTRAAAARSSDPRFALPRIIADGRAPDALVELVARGGR